MERSDNIIPLFPPKEESPIYWVEQQLQSEVDVGTWNYYYERKEAKIKEVQHLIKITERWAKPLEYGIKLLPRTKGILGHFRKIPSTISYKTRRAILLDFDLSLKAQKISASAFLKPETKLINPSYLIECVVLI